ncbi:hypothetical protein DFH06DRAFT_1343642 [Mycena polygramma]|nr:hypothetical protein DFH06DRAFT_1343642 [Mycena polygramma]
MPPRLTRALSLRGDAAPPLPRTTSAPPPRPLSLSFPVQRQTPISPGPHAHVILPSPDVMHSPHWPLTIAPLAEAHMRHRTPATCAPAPCDTSAPPRSLAFSFIALRATVSKRHVVPTYSSLVEHTILAPRASCLDTRQQSTAHVPRPRAMMHLIPVPRRIAASQAVAPDRAAATKAKARCTTAYRIRTRPAHDVVAAHEHGALGAHERKAPWLRQIARGDEEARGR